MNDETDRRADQILSNLKVGLAAHVSVPPVTRAFRRATPLHRALFRLEDVAAEVSLPSVTSVIRRATPRRGTLAAGCSICALGVLGATLFLVPGGSNGSIGSELWAQRPGGTDSTSQSSPLTMPAFSNDQLAQDANQLPTTLAAAAPPAAAQAAAAQAAAAKTAAAQAAAAQAAAAKNAAAQAAAARTAAAQTAAAQAAAGTAATQQSAAQSLATELPTTTQLPPTATTQTVLTPPVSPITQGDPLTLIASVTATPSVTVSFKVQFFMDGTSLGSVPVNNGTATLNVPKTRTLRWSPVLHRLTAVSTFTTANVSASPPSDSVPLQVLKAQATTSGTGAPLAAANTNGAPTVTPPRGRGKLGPPTGQLQQQAPAEQLPVQGSSRHH